AALVPGFAWPRQELDRAWTLLLWNGAHDSVCGCSHDQVARDVDARYAEARALAEGVAWGALGTLASLVGEPGVLRFNPSPFEREGVPGLGWQVEPGPIVPAEVPLEVEAPDGWVLADGIAFTLRDEPDIGDLYNFCPTEDGQQAREPVWTVAAGTADAVFDDGLRAHVRVARREGEAFLRLNGEIDNRGPDHRLRLHVRLPPWASGSVAGSPFELVERGLVSEGSALEAPSPTWPARHVVLAGGVAAYGEGVFEYEVVPGELAITLLRCVGTISREHLATRPFAAGPDVPTPDAQMIGTTGFAIGLNPKARPDELMPSWERFALPLLEVPAEGYGSLPSTGTLLSVEGEAVLSNVRRTDGPAEVRLWNPHADRPVRVQVDGRAVT
ncbi:MAG: hypothetical protein ACRDHK_13910, partial [Actinomycetota bacterium]